MNTDFQKFFQGIDDSEVQVAEHLFELSNQTKESYYKALEAIDLEFEIEEFAPWDMKYVLHQCVVKIKEEFGYRFRFQDSRRF